jgi:8-oxo-dGTP pyrophosphatase MutT (NUDIX family)
MNPDIPKFLAQRLREPLPSFEVRARLAPTLSFGRHFGPAAHDARDAAVILLLYPHDDDWLLPLTVRPSTMLAHAGQVSLPGGVVESGESPRDAALRELDEELGISPRDVSIVGQLSPVYVFVSNFLVTPWVATLATRPTMRPNPDEVDAVLEVPLAHLADRANVGAHVHHHGELSFTVPHYRFGEHVIWGATSVILSELVAVVGPLYRHEGSDLIGDMP